MCGKIFYNSVNMKRHMVNNHELHSCKVCGRRPRTWSIMLNHKKEDNVVIVFKYIPTLAVHIFALCVEMCMCNLLFVHYV